MTLPYWTTTYVDRKFSNLGWAENALAKQHGSMQGPWDAEFTQVNWTTTNVLASADTKNYWWNGRQNVGTDQTNKIYPPIYVGGITNYPNVGGWYAVTNDSPVLRVGSPGNTGWINNAFDWNESLANNEKVSGSMTFLISQFTSGASADSLGRVRLLWVNAPYTNGLNAFSSLYASDKLTINSQGWRTGGSGDWNKWEFNPDTAGDLAPAGQVYVYNSFNMTDPVSNTNFFRAIELASVHTFSWTAQYIPGRDVVRMATALDGEAWTTTDVNRGFNNLGWAENALAKQHGSMQGPWSAEIGVLTWATSPADPTISTTRLPDGNVEVTWPFGTLLEATNVKGPWTPVLESSPHKVAPVTQKFYRVLVHQ